MEKPRLIGIDLISGIAAFAVAILHSGDVTTATTVGFWATQVQRFCGFAVPFFLISSFYLSIDRIYKTGKSPLLKSKFQRLIIPYVFWSLFYIIARLIKLLLLQEPVNIARLSDPISIIFLGNAGIHLYFIPMLFTGVLFLTVIEKLIIKKVNFFQIVLLFLISLLVDNIVFLTDNSFLLGPYIAFDSLLDTVFPNGNENPFIRVSLVLLAWLIKCLPYIFAAMILNHLLAKNHLRSDTGSLLISLAVFLGISYFGFLGIDLNSAIYTDHRPPFYDIAKSIPLLLFSIHLSFCLHCSTAVTSIVKSLGICSFGIYLMHQFLIQVIRLPASEMFPDLVYNVSVSTQLFFAFFSVGVSWLATILLMKRRKLSRLLFGL
ncbi:acyltransferase family protein [Leptolyngbya sp. 7M]|uniref:acyltransferase family protein n=1 Tax=Leptolyngbya sp. 7M TaxID=2812896 RepID=UPI001B8CBEDF|nr:acyltransferase [Leptolyngbya sp. 7M]QYO64301.1 acyltransferase [Leptolyngbya sp. 7M]